MSVLVDESTRVLVQGLTGSQGRFHGLRNRAYGTNVVAGVTPGKGGQSVTFEEDPIPVFNSVAEARHATGANVSCVFVPPPHAKKAVMDAIDSGIDILATQANNAGTLGTAMVEGRMRLSAKATSSAMLGSR